MHRKNNSESPKKLLLCFTVVAFVLSKSIMFTKAYLEILEFSKFLNFLKISGKQYHKGRQGYQVPQSGGSPQASLAMGVALWKFSK